MAASQHTTNIPSQTPQGEVTNNETNPPLPEDIPGRELRYYEITREQLRALRPTTRDLINQLRFTPIMEYLAHTRTPPENITPNGAIASTIPELVNLMLEDLANAVEENDPVLQEGEEFADTGPFPDSHPNQTRQNNNQAHPLPGDGEGGRGRGNVDRGNRARRNEGERNRGRGAGGRGDRGRGQGNQAHNRQPNPTRPPVHNLGYLRDFFAPWEKPRRKFPS